ncbi:hypothetical protein J4Q44_G00376480 [Coregonus suidteri]|uniref:Uncharacterized protein n=1 Tax=Coregonus suidteri TaxID=861788 RepID=A0AAN8KI24_9TELE
MCQCVVHTCIIYEQNYCLTSISHKIPSLKVTVFLEAVLRHFLYIFPHVGQPSSNSSSSQQTSAPHHLSDSYQRCTHSRARERATFRTTD